jgi:hypothetical protein
MSFYISSMLDTNSDQLTIFINTQAKVLEYTTIHRSLFEGYKYVDCYLVGGGGGGGTGADGSTFTNYAGGGGGSGNQTGYIPAIDNGPGGTGINYTLVHHAPATARVDLTTYTDLSFILTIVGQGGTGSTSGGTSSVVFYDSTNSQIGPSIDAFGGIKGGDATSGTNGDGGDGYYAGGGGAGGNSGISGSSGGAGGIGCVDEGGYNGGAGINDSGGLNIYAGAGAGPSGAGGNGAGCKFVEPCAESDTVGGDGGGANYLGAGVVCGAKATDKASENGSNGAPFTGQGGGGGAYYQGHHAPGDGGSGFIILRFHD